jgi:glycosyltransferase involved in cell wall biosynthesis
LQFAARQDGVEIVHIDSSVRFRPVWNLGYAIRVVGGLFHTSALLARYASALLFRRIDVVHLTTSGSLGFLRDIVFSAVGRILRKPVVLHMHFGRLAATIKSNNWQARLAAIACRIAGNAIALDLSSSESIQLLAPSCRVSTVGNPAWILDDGETMGASRERSNVIAFVGWIIPAKGVYELVEACREITDLPFRLQLTGPVSEEVRKRLEDMAAGRDGGKWLEISGPVDGREATARIAGAAMLVLPSYTEGAPYVVLEAMALCTPVISTPVGAIPQMLAFDHPSPCGLCVPIRDIEALREAIRALLSSAHAAEEMASRAKERVGAEYSPAAVFAQYELAWRNASAEGGYFSRVQKSVVAE